MTVTYFFSCFLVVQRIADVSWREIYVLSLREHSKLSLENPPPLERLDRLQRMITNLERDHNLIERWSPNSDQFKEVLIHHLRIKLMEQRSELHQLLNQYEFYVDVKINHGHSKYSRY